MKRSLISLGEAMTHSHFSLLLYSPEPSEIVPAEVPEEGEQAQLPEHVTAALKVKVFLPAGQSLHTEEPVTFEYFPAMRMQQSQHRYPPLSPSPPPTEPNRVLGLRVRDEV